MVHFNEAVQFSVSDPFGITIIISLKHLYVCILTLDESFLFLLLCLDLETNHEQMINVT